MIKKICDYCKKEINSKEIIFELQIWKVYKARNEDEIDCECDFCNSVCLGKWMIKKANEYGVYDE